MCTVDAARPARSTGTNAGAAPPPGGSACPQQKDGLVIHYVVSGDILLSFQHRSGGASAGKRAPAAERTGS